MRQEGTISFEYQVDAEQYFDYLIFKLDQVEKFRVSQQLSWKKESFNLSVGHHTFEWSFTKDFIIGKGEDKAKLRNIILTNVVDVALSCDPCPPGTFSKNGSFNCTLCPEGTYNPVEGASTCLDCPPLEDSFPGSTKCRLKSPACFSHDYFHTFTNCQQNQRTKQYQWIHPILCNQTLPTSVQLPNNETVPCDTHCLPGFELDVNSECKVCSGNTFSRNGDKCATCPAGKQLGLKTYFITEWKYPLLPNWKTGCDGDCSSKGWRMIGRHADSGYANGVSSSWLEIPVEKVAGFPNTTSDLQLHYELSCIKGSGSLQISIDGKIERNIFCSGCNTNYNIEQLNLTVGLHTLRVEYVSGILHDSHFTCNRAVLRNISVLASVEGGSTDCLDCKSGLTSSSGDFECKTCLAGLQPNANQSQCEVCPINQFSRPGYSKCQDCGIGMKTSTSGDPFCSWNDGTGSYSFNSKQYQISNLM
jgi:hypothetical protein